MTGKVLVTGESVRPDILAPLIAAGLEVDNPPGILDEEALAEHLKGASAYLLGGDEKPASESALAAASNLKIIAFLGVGYASFINVAAANSLRIAVTNTPGTLTQSVAEFSVAHILNATRQISLNIHHASEHYRLGNKSVPDDEMRHDLASLGVGIIGLGAIGTRVAEILRLGFGCKVSYWSRTRKRSEEERLGLEYQELYSLLKSNKVIVLVVPGDDSTKMLIDDRAFSALSEGSILVNITKSSVVSSRSLLAALKANRLEAAIFDQFYDEKVEEYHQLLALPEQKLLLTRHIGSLTHEARSGMGIKAVNSIINYLKSGDDEYLVNREALSVKG